MVTIRNLTTDDIDAVVELALDAWEPVFDSMAQTVGPHIFRLLFGDDWREYQEADIRRALATYDVSVAAAEVGVVGYVAVDLPANESHGEIYMIAVAPSHQGGGIGSALTAHAVDQIRAAGRMLAVVETGGDPGHAAARATYDKAGFVPLPAERYYLAL